ncbi:hypothetical protein [Rhodococcus sp. IEGM 1408]|uniref:hypothetical protein n=1 Tax=Rhodococcus sp. IEGM 1408 TaxID=3082220 RepID=UPI0029534D73|nr:hypothetical protein [Rhodococcus sp. IEGM 1408]MDV8002871.1 hypothetical protein [Rhodococcus sp. IEGM 1408]
MTTFDTWTQSQVEIEVRNALIARTDSPNDWETVSDAVDVYLGGIEREETRVLDREAIDRTTVFAVVESIVRAADDQ